MKIAVIGAGFTGLSASYELVKRGHDVTVFEKDGQPGGLAIGYKEKNWKWSLEKHYHHWFTNDKSVLSLAKEINYEVVIRRPKTSVFVKNKIYQLDSPITVLKFPLLSFLQRLRMSVVIGFLKFYPFWKTLERYKASELLPNLMGKKPYEMIWQPLFVNKFGEFANNVSLSWFWARITKRTSSLAYPKGGFLSFANYLVKNIENKGGKAFFGTEILELKDEGKIKLKFANLNGNTKEEIFDKAIITTPSFLFLKIAPQLPKEYKDKLGKLKSLGATNLILRLNKPFFPDETYWLSICEKNAPIMAIVEHTNFMDKKNYDDEHLLYLGNYKPQNDSYFYMNKDDMLKKFDSYLKKINPTYSKNIVGYELFKAPFAQPVIPINYSKILPPFETPLKNVFLANIEQVYPWDRGTNYAVELGQKVSRFIKDK
ncbi:MAG TPA: FAD-dependent oxidoreductase [Candidatus Sulfotelmatobacter sp.]|nr:FAD-dependent oxidoreductase [Candidatus Sulfotelmatobacter sp.]